MRLDDKWYSFLVPSFLQENMWHLEVHFRLPCETSVRQEHFMFYVFVTSYSPITSYRNNLQEVSFACKLWGMYFSWINALPAFKIFPDIFFHREISPVTFCFPLCFFFSLFLSCTSLCIWGEYIFKLLEPSRLRIRKPHSKISLLV